MGTAFVLYLHHIDVPGWKQVLTPFFLRSNLRRTIAPSASATDWKGVGGHSRWSQACRSLQDVVYLEQLLQQCFLILDQDKTGMMSPWEIEEFGRFMAGRDWDTISALQEIQNLGISDDMFLDIEQFANFCHAGICGVELGDVHDFRKRMITFQDVMNCKRDLLNTMWRKRARRLDEVSRWMLPPGFMLYLLIQGSGDIRYYNQLAPPAAESNRATLIMSGIIPLLLGGLAYVAYMCKRSKPMEVIQDSKKAALEMTISSNNKSGGQKATPEQILMQIRGALRRFQRRLAARRWR